MNALTYNGDAALKAQHVAQAEHHLAADMLRAGTYGEGRGKAFKACSVGCFAHDVAPRKANRHGAVADHYALPEWLIRLQDAMFEGLPETERNTFHVELTKRIPVGVSLDPVPHLIAISRIDRMLVTQRKALGDSAGAVQEAIAQVIVALEIGRRAHEAAAGGNTCELPAAESAAAWAAGLARSAAWSAAESAGLAAESAGLAAWAAGLAAWSAAESAGLATWAAGLAAWSAGLAAESAGLAAWAAGLAAESAAWSDERDALYAALAQVPS